MQVDLTLRASMAREVASGPWKARLEEAIGALEAGRNPDSKRLVASPNRPGVYLAEIDEHFLVFQRLADKVHVMDIMMKPEAS